MPAIHAGMTKLSIFMLCRRAQAHESLLSNFSFTGLDVGAIKACSGCGSLSLRIRPREKIVCNLVLQSVNDTRGPAAGSFVCLSRCEVVPLVQRCRTIAHSARSSVAGLSTSDAILIYRQRKQLLPATGLCFSGT
jgi:hypothetical protein